MALVVKFTASSEYLTCHFLHIVNPLILHCFKVLVSSLVAGISQQNTSSRDNLKQNRAINSQSNNTRNRLGSRSEKQSSCVPGDANRNR